MHPEITLNIFNTKLVITTYKLFIIISMTIGFLLSYFSLKKKGYTFIDILIVFIPLVVAFFIGARLLNFIVNADEYIANNISIFELKFKNFSLYGGILFSIIISFIMLTVINKDHFEFYDTILIPFLISFIIMRIGCFLNGCCFGHFTSSIIGVPMPQKLAVKSTEVFAKIPFFSSSSMKVYPTQLMEAGFALLFVPITLLLKKKIYLYIGSLTIICGIYFSAFRWFVLYFRMLPYPDYITTYAYPILYLSLIILGTSLLIYQYKRKTT